MWRGTGEEMGKNRMRSERGIKGIKEGEEDTGDRGDKGEKMLILWAKFNRW